MTKMNCQAAQDRFQELLDERRGEPLPVDLQEHLTDCVPCQSWQALLSIRPAPFCETVPNQFAERVLQRHQWERRKQRWLRGSSLLALAASLLIACVAWYLSIMPKGDLKQPFNQTDVADTRTKIINDLQDGFAKIRTRANTLQLPAISLPDNLPSWELPAADPMAYSMPALRTISNSLQGAIEPLEAPAKAAYSKVKSVIDDPELRKWVSKLNGRST